MIKKSWITYDLSHENAPAVSSEGLKKFDSINLFLSTRSAMVVGMNGSLRQHILKESRLPFFFARNALISDDFGLVHIVRRLPRTVFPVLWEAPFLSSGAIYSW